MHIDVPARPPTLPVPRPALRRRRAAVIASVFALGTALLVPAAVAAPDDNGVFELDGNVIAEADAGTPPRPGQDWSDVFAGSDTAFVDTGIVPDAAPLSIFTQGASKDDLDVPGWRHKNGSVPDKDDITNAYAAAYASSGDTYVYFGLDRFAVQGSANVGFWFFQDDVAPVPGAPAGTTSSFTGEHTAGDLLVLSEFDEGGGGISIKVFKWVGSGGDEGGGTLQTLFGGDTGSPADCDSTTAAANVCANVNTAPIVDANIPWNYVGKGGSRTMPAASFFEGGINLDAFFGQAPCFTNVVAETRSSFEVNAVLKDFVHSSFELCGAEIAIGPDAVNDVGDSHTFTVTASTTSVGIPSDVPDGTIVTVTLTDAGGTTIVPTDNTCADPGTVGGECEVTFTSSTAGVVTGHAEADIGTGENAIHVETGADGDNPDALKRFVDARVTIDPDDVNGIGEPHVFTVDAEVDLGDGAGWVAATTGNADVTLTDTLGAASTLDAAASTCDDAQPDGDNLDASGRCTVKFVSATTGKVTGAASVKIDLTTAQGTIQLQRTTNGADGNSDAAVKEYVDGSLSWFKNDDTGARLGGASFEVCQTHGLNTATAPDSFVLLTPAVCVTVLDNSTRDTNKTNGEFTLIDLALGRYTVDEVAPFPVGYDPDTSVKSADLTLQPGPRDATISVAFVNRRLFRLIVITCNTTTEALVDSTVTLGGATTETVKPSQLNGISESTLCQLPGANYDNLAAGQYSPSVELPDVAPLHPTP